MVIKVAFFTSTHMRLKNNRIYSNNSWAKFISGIAQNGVSMLVVAPTFDKLEKAFMIEDEKILLRNIQEYDTYVQYYVNLIKNAFSHLRIYYRSIRDSDLVLYRIPTPGLTLVFLLTLFLKKEMEI